MNKYKIKALLLSFFICFIVFFVFLNSKDTKSNVDVLSELKIEINEERREKKENYKHSKYDIETLCQEQIFELDEFKKYGFNQSDLIFDYYATNTDMDYSKTITKEAAKSDIESLFFLLPNTYVAYNYMGGYSKFEIARNKILEELDQVDEITLDEFCDIIMKNLSFIKDNHFSIGNKLPQTVENNTFVKAQVTSSDYLLEKDHKGYFIKSNLAKKYISSVCYDDDFSEYISPIISENGEIKYTLVKLVDLNTLLNQEEISINVKFSNNDEEIVKLEYPGEVPVLQYNEPVKTTIENDIYTIKVPSFTGDNPYEFFKTAEEAKKYENVIIDIRGNSGGNANYLIPWLETFTGLSDIRKYLDGETLRMSTISSRKSSNWIYKEIESENKELIYNKKNLYVVYDKRAASTSEDLLRMLSSVENVVLVGANSMGCSIAGYVQIFRLPNSDVFCKWGNTLWLDSEYYVPEGIGMAPDIVVNDINDAVELTKKMIEYYD